MQMSDFSYCNNGYMIRQMYIFKVNCTQMTVL